MKWYQSTIALIIVFLFATGAPHMIADSNKISEQPDELSEFLIVIERTGEEIHLTCKEGCAFKELSFSQYINFWNLFTFSYPQAINQKGMTNVSSNKTKNDQSKFLFSIKKTKNGLELSGIKGTSWKNLSIPCSENNCLLLIDENGMTTAK